jgi:hypothetical protein
MLKEHQKGVLMVDLPEYGLKAGDAYEVEFFTLDGQTLDVVTVAASQIRPVSSTEIMHARPMG